jgi:uroporphyrinogen-III decarboxylase
MNTNHIDTIKKAIEFRSPDYLPMEILDVPGIYNNNHTLDPKKVEYIPGTENFDSMWTNCYSWFHEDIGYSDDGGILRKDQFGTIIRIPESHDYTYAIVNNPLKGRDSLAGYSFPDPNETRPHFNKLGEIITARYTDRFINGFIDPGFLVSTQLLIGIQDFFYKIVDNITFVSKVYEGLMEYYTGIVVNYKNSGAHMITDIESIGSNAGLIMNPEIWRRYFKPVIKKFFKYVHEQGLYTSICIDGNSREILDDIFDLGVDLIFFVDINTTGINLIRDKFKGKICIKSTIDMKDTLGLKTPGEVAKEAHRLVRHLNGPTGGFICEVLRWNRPEYPPENVIASVDAFNEYRK